MSIRNPKMAVFAQFAEVAKALGHANRLELLEQLAQGERTVEVLAQRTGLSIANASQHLQHMRRCVGLPSGTWPRSSGSCAAISMIAMLSNRCLAKSFCSGRAPARSRCST